VVYAGSSHGILGVVAGFCLIGFFQFHSAAFVTPHTVLPFPFVRHLFVQLLCDDDTPHIGLGAGLTPDSPFPIYYPSVGSGLEILVLFRKLSIPAFFFIFAAWHFLDTLPLAFLSFLYRTIVHVVACFMHGTKLLCLPHWKTYFNFSFDE